MHGCTTDACQVFVGRDESTWEKVAVKHIKQVPNFCSGHAHEYVMTRKLNHPHIVKALHCVEQRKDRYANCRIQRMFNAHGSRDTARTPQVHSTRHTVQSYTCRHAALAS